MQGEVIVNPQDGKLMAYEDEINLYNLWKNIMKRIKLIFWIFIISIISVGSISFMMPKIYHGEVGVRIQLKELISTKELYGIFNNLNRERIEAIFPQFPDSIKEVTIRQIAGSTDKFKIIFEISQKTHFEEAVKIFMRNLNSIPLIAKAVEQSREQLSKRLEEIDLVISKSREDAEHFERMMVKDKLNPIGFNPVQFNKMRYDLEVEKITLEQSIKNLTGFEMVTNPIIFQKPVRPRPLLYMAIAGVISLIVGVFLTMFFTYMENIKR